MAVSAPPRCDTAAHRRATLEPRVRGYRLAYERGLGGHEHELFQCPALGELGDGQRDRLAHLVKRHCEIAAAADGVQGEATEDDAPVWPPSHTPGPGGFFETSAWPRPRHCSSPRRNRPARRVWARKWVSHVAELEVRPVLKVGSTTLARILPCLPGNWTSVPSETDTSYRPVVLVRSVVDRFAAAAEEVMARFLLGECPSGPCSQQRDAFSFANKTLVNASMRESGWLGLAAAIHAQAAAGRRPTPEQLTDLVRAIANDTACNVRYYAAEHFETMTRQLVQGRAATEPWIFALSELGETTAEMISSPLVAALLNGASMNSSEVANPSPNPSPNLSPNPSPSPSSSPSPIGLAL